MKYFFVFIIVIFLCLLFVWQGIYLPKEIASEKSLIFLVKKGQSVEEIASNLESQGLIKSKYFFTAYVLIRKKATELKAGQYQLSPSMNIPGIADKMVSGDRVKKLITIIEGWTVKDIEEYLGEKIDPGLEGYLFPDTYEISPEDELEEIVGKMRQNFEKKLSPELREEIAEQGKTISQIVIMASLLEKEVQTLKDKKIVAGILWKRLENNIPLQIDATITYITGRKTTEITKEELAIDSPYNTYKYKGLPAGPICNPGLDSILAAIEPEKTDYWFYLSTPEGQTIFSKTLKEHNLAKEKYLK